MRARAEFDAALAIDPRDPPAHVGLAWIHTTNVLFGWSEAPQGDLTSAEAHVDAALRSDPDYFYAFSVRGMIALLRGEHERAVEYGEQALRLSGGGADALALHALTLSYTGDVERSLQLAQRALRLRPYTHPEWYEWILARAARLNGAPQTTLACLPQTALQDSGIRAATVEQALALSALGQSRDAQRLMRSVINQNSLTAEAYCARPPYATEALTRQCVAAMRGAGAP
jgi:Tfp pilus assembly protein PilF